MRLLGLIAAIFVAVVAAVTVWLFTLGPWGGVDLSAQAPAPRPSLANVSVEEWLSGRDELLQAFEAQIYGAAPLRIAPVAADKRAMPPAAVAGVRNVEQWRVDLGDAGRFHLLVVRPDSVEPAPVVIVMTFCGARAAFPGRPEAVAPPVGYAQWFCHNAAADPVARLLFGRYVHGPPVASIAQRGYAVALLYGGDIVPDGADHARAALSRFAPEDTGALMAWAWTASRAFDALAADPRFDASRIALFGQSRQGKAALVAGAFDPRFAAIVALQSGRGGDAPNRAFAGESIAHITRTYPHWFAQAYAEQTPSVEQHQLLALIAPRPLLLGHAERDTWSDPVGAEAMREAAAPVFLALGAEPPSSFVRPGGHGITTRDWEETLNFLDARLRPREGVPAERRNDGLARVGG